MSNQKIIESAERIQALVEKMIEIVEEVKRDLKEPEMIGREDGKVNEIEGMGYWKPKNNIK